MFLIIYLVVMGVVFFYVVFSGLICLILKGVLCFGLMKSVRCEVVRGFLVKLLKCILSFDLILFWLVLGIGLVNVM